MEYLEISLTMECYLAIKRNKSLIHLPTWLNHQIILLMKGAIQKSTHI